MQGFIAFNPVYLLLTINSSSACDRVLDTMKKNTYVLVEKKLMANPPHGDAIIMGWK
jgi:hypothetical protein